MPLRGIILILAVAVEVSSTFQFILVVVGVDDAQAFFTGQSLEITLQRIAVLPGIDQSTQPAVGQAAVGFFDPHGQTVVERDARITERGSEKQNTVKSGSEEVASISNAVTFAENTHHIGLAFDISNAVEVFLNIDIAGLFFDPQGTGRSGGHEITDSGKLPPGGIKNADIGIVQINRTNRMKVYM